MERGIFGGILGLIECFCCVLTIWGGDYFHVYIGLSFRVKLGFLGDFVSTSFVTKLAFLHNKGGNINAFYGDGDNY